MAFCLSHKNVITGLWLFVLCTGFSSAMIIDNGLGNPEIVYPIREYDYVKPHCKSSAKPLDLLFIIDSSGSLRLVIDEVINVIRDVVNIVSIAPDATRVAMVQYSGYARTEFHFNELTSRQQILDRLSAVRPIKGVTRTGNAIAHSFAELSTEFGHRGGNVPTIAFIVSDGRTQDYPNDGVQAAKMRASGVDVWAYGTGEYVAIEELVNLTADANKIVTQKNYQHLQELFAPFKSIEICEKVEAAVCVPGSDKPLDLLFVIDSSESIEENFREHLNFVRRVLTHVNVHHDAVRVAMINYAAKPSLDFDFKQYDTKELVLQGISNLRSKNTTTRTDLALQLALDVLTNGQQKGVRNESVPKMIIVITDGRSQREPTEESKKLADRNNVIVFAVGVVPSERLDAKELLVIAGNHSNRVFTGSNLLEFENEFKNYVSMGCPGVKGNLSDPIVRAPIDVQCKENSIVVNVRTLNPFSGKLYAVGYEEDTKCFVLGQNDTHTSITIAVDSCGFKKTPVLDGSKSGYALSGDLMLQFHPVLLTKVDRALPVSCSVIGDGVSLKDDAVNRTTRIHDLTCTYSLRQYDVGEGCVALDARVGENLYHKWDCDMSSNYAVLVHDCYAFADNQRSIQIVDEHGCQIDPYAFETPTYDRHYVYRYFPVFKFPGSKWISFKCQVSFCDKDNGECGGIVPPICDEKLKSTRPKRAINFVKSMQVETRGVNVLENMHVKHLEEVRYCSTYDI